MNKKILILGINGFIGSNLAERILADTDWNVYGLDLGSDKITAFLDHKRMHFTRGDMTKSSDWLDQHIALADVVLPLAAIANPLVYVQDPLRVFELDFEANLDIVKRCHFHKTRVVFPSTSEVYGMSTDAEFDEDNTALVTGPIHMQRWIYSCSKQMLDRVIYAYGKHRGLQYTLFRPFNWIGPKLDNVFEESASKSRVVSKFLSQIVRGENIELVDGGQQRRAFTYIDDGISALMKIIENTNGCADNEIFNIGNPNNDLSIGELAKSILDLAKTYPKYQESAAKVQITNVDSAQHYGAGYQDVAARVPAIHNAKNKLGWQPEVDMDKALRLTLDYYLL
ncbi:MAG: bifunctional UDP-4-keto-pentose/UDP-xylose synthase [Pseudomonadota bacterium]|nr:bifunctional UDP-4-keto-pentose/UDP-xylose synthase [Pseudomonadota bacterium]